MPKNKKKTFLSCPECGDEFEVKRPWHKYCSAGCRRDAWEKENPRVKQWMQRNNEDILVKN